MGNAAKVGDIGTDHDGFPPTKILSGSPDVFIDGIPAARVGDPLEPHDKPNTPEHGVVAQIDPAWMELT
ncbi:PAAR domain-containing protein [Aeromonas allosaccharophila]|uniref:PAAR domain-containing protein n=1 Tax=Aeromonas allosaccharophila TaxID=656 RepID=UPI0011197856|nr:PAAR domain-containing protein [Aeromonas allosaccharophila]